MEPNVFFVKCTMNPANQYPLKSDYLLYLLDFPKKKINIGGIY